MFIQVPRTHGEITNKKTIFSELYYISLPAKMAVFKKRLNFIPNFGQIKRLIGHCM